VRGEMTGNDKLQGFHSRRTSINNLLCYYILRPSDTQSSLDYIQLENIKKIDLKLHQILKNNVALSYFIDYVSSQRKQLDLFFYLNIEGKGVN
jgi:hypothetical protein